MRNSRFKVNGLFFVLISVFLVSGLSAEEPLIPNPEDTTKICIPRPPTNVLATDAVYDKGNVVNLNWVPSPDDIGDGKILQYQILRRLESDSVFTLIDSVIAGTAFYKDETVESGQTYQYMVVAICDGGSGPSKPSPPVTPDMEWLNFALSNIFVIGLLICGSVIYFIGKAKSGRPLFIRKIAGLEAVDEAIGRATEMGRPILYVPGIQDMDDVQTIAGLTILGRVARVVADYDTKIKVPVSRSLVMTASRETLKAAYMAAGRPDAFNENMAQYITDEQFGYVAAVDGMIIRERPATTFFLGAFFAESLILAETGNSIGAIQIGGTANPAQLPFFVAACDFTLIGEELFAASAYLSGEPRQLGSLKGQDVGKALAMIAIVLGAITTTIGQAWNFEFISAIADLLNSLFRTN
jgi:hypothetical protein